MKNRYEDPTQRLQSHGWSEEYKENYEKIFGKKETWLERRERERVVLKDLPSCSQQQLETLTQMVLPLMDEDNDDSSD